MKIAKLFFFMSLLSLLIFNEDAKNNNNSSEHKYKELSSLAEYKELIKGDKPVVIKLHAVWCQPCKDYDAAFSAFAEENRDLFNAAAINIDNQQFADLVQKEGIKTIPTTWFIQNGKIIKSDRGAFSKMALTARAKDLFGMGAEQREIKEEHKKFMPRVVSDEEEPSNVKVLSTMKEYENLVASQKPVIVKFFAEWCDACIEFKAIFEKVAEQYANKATFVAIDVQNPAFKKLSNKYAEEYPTVLFINKGQIKNSTGGVLAEGSLKRYVESLIGTEKMVKMQMKEPEEEEEFYEEEVIERPRKKMEKKQYQKRPKKSRYYYDEDFDY